MESDKSQSMCQAAVNEAKNSVRLEESGQQQPESGHNSAPMPAAASQSAAAPRAVVGK